MKSIFTAAILACSLINASAGGPDSSKVKLTTTAVKHISEPAEWASPMPVSLQDEKSLDIFKRRLSEIWQKHTKELIKEKEESTVL